MKLKNIFPKITNSAILIFLLFFVGNILLPQNCFAIQVEQYTLKNFILRHSEFKTLWESLVGVLDVAAVIGFIILGLANIFHIKYDEYQVQRVLPRIIIGLILANLSYSICFFFVTFTQYITDLFIGSPQEFAANFSALYGWLNAIITALGTGGIVLTLLNPLAIGLVLFALLLFLAPILLIIAIGGILWVRAFGIVVLISVSQLAFFLMYFPIEIPLLTDQARKWVNMFTKWLAIGPVIFFLFWMAFSLNKGLANVKPVPRVGGNFLTDIIDNYWISMILSIVIGILAITIPWGLTSDAINAIKSGLNKLKGHVGGALQKTGLKAAGQIFAAGTVQKLLKNKTARKAISTVGGIWRSREHAKSLWEETKADVTKAIDFSTILKELKRRGTLEGAPEVIRSLAKRLGGENLAKAMEVANTMSPFAIGEELKRLNAREFLEALNARDTERLASFKEEDVQQIQQYLAALVQQSRNFNPEISAPAKNYLQEIRGDLYEGQIETADLRTFQLGQPIRRPGALVAENPDYRETLNPLRQDYQQYIGAPRGEFQFSGRGIESIQNLRRAIFDSAQAQTQTLSTTIGRLGNTIGELVARGIAPTHIEATHHLRADLNSAYNLIAQGTQESIQQGTNILNQIGIPVASSMPQEKLRRTIEAAQRWLSIYEGRANQGLTHAEATNQTSQSFSATMLQSHLDKEIAAIASRITGTRVGADTVSQLRSGGTTLQLQELTPQQQEFIKRLVGELASRPPNPT